MLHALVACGRRGRWKAALGLLAQLEAADGETPLPAYHSALLACRKKERTEEASDVLRRMGDLADTSAYNEVLHHESLEWDARSSCLDGDADYNPKSKSKRENIRSSGHSLFHVRFDDRTHHMS